jgi:hypothetical protein
MYNLTSEKKRFVFSILSTALLAMVALLVVPDISLGQPGLPNDPEQTPIDGGLGILAALGGTYAIKKLREKE